MTIGQLAEYNSNSGSKGISSITNGQAASQSARMQGEVSKFQQLLNDLTSSQKDDPEPKNAGISSSMVSKEGRLNGEYTSSLAIENPTPSDKRSLPQGFALNVGEGKIVSEKTIDRTSKLYEQSLELENYFVKIMLSSMRNTVQKADQNGQNSYAAKMYEDMMYDELSVAMTKNAGFGLADKIYLSLV